MLWFGLALISFFARGKVSSDLGQCWNQVADEDHFIGEQVNRVEDVKSKLERLKEDILQLQAELQGQITECSNQISMTRDYVTGLHYAIVEHGGFLRNGLGLNQTQWVHLNVLERANLIASRTAGSKEYMRLARQRFNPAERADETDNVEMEDSENVASENDDDAMDPYSEMPRRASSPNGATNGTELVEFLKNEHDQCVERQEFWDANAIQNLILIFLDNANAGSSTAEMVGQCKQKISAMFNDLHVGGVSGNRWDSADRYQALASLYGNT
eukprot:s875_g21.t1